MATLKFEERLWAQGFRRVMGLDEVGRGCLAGPVVAAGVILDPDRIPKGLHDSKQLPVKERMRLDEEIRATALFWAVREGSVSRIDSMNILWASIETMRECAEDPDAAPDYLLVDGNRYAPSLIPVQCVVKGDSLSASIAAASILAKQHRDALMARLHEEHPQFGWDRNVGYPTIEHRRALVEHGPTPWHRTSFAWKAP
jgi:ribonuclease HII